MRAGHFAEVELERGEPGYPLRFAGKVPQAALVEVGPVGDGCQGHGDAFGREGGGYELVQGAGTVVEAAAVEGGDDELIPVDGLDEIGLLFVAERL